jgi:gamma-glutamyltranspeptidase / glutathione hydrolase / leukotriene-C4 hydrolase
MYVNPDTDKIYEEGERIKNVKLAETLSIIAEEGAGSIYSARGSLGQKFVDEIQANGGIVTMDDLRSYNPKWGSTVSTKLFNGDRLHTTPLPSSGCLLTFILNVLEGYKIQENSFDYHNQNKLLFHRIVEAFKFAFGYRTRLGDVMNADVVETERELQSNEFANRIITYINDEHTFNDTNYYGAKGTVNLDYGTAHLSILASNGDAVSLTSTINYV